MASIVHPSNLPWGGAWHDLLVHRLGVHRWPLASWWYTGSEGGFVTTYHGVDGHRHVGQFCAACGKKFLKDQHDIVGNLGAALYEPHALEVLCTHMVAKRRGLAYPPNRADAAIAAEVMACMYLHGAGMPKE